MQIGHSKEVNPCVMHRLPCMMHRPPFDHGGIVVDFRVAHIPDCG